jgi:alkanesulfonate monooxygenase SsuD/methylene tetrahydromethanopterin reductase-like flavin-dependent oxidoreductase (luciferase family)
VPFFQRHPLVAVQRVSVIAALAPGRFRLGVGSADRASVTGQFGIDFQAPLGHLRDYVRIQRDAIHAGAVHFDGRYYRSPARLPTPIRPAVPVLAAALRERALRLGGEVADGVITWVCPLPYVRDVGLPAVRDGAHAVGHTAPSLFAQVPFCLSEDTDAARVAAREHVAIYARLRFWARMLATAGLPEAARGEWSDAAVDAIVLHGREQHVGERLLDFLHAGADEVIATPIRVGDRQRALARSGAFPCQPRADLAPAQRFTVGVPTRSFSYQALLQAGSRLAVRQKVGRSALPCQGVDSKVLSSSRTPLRDSATVTVRT